MSAQLRSNQIVSVDSLISSGRDKVSGKMLGVDDVDADYVNVDDSGDKDGDIYDAVACAGLFFWL